MQFLHCHCSGPWQCPAPASGSVQNNFAGELKLALPAMLSCLLQLDLHEALESAQHDDDYCFSAGLDWPRLSSIWPRLASTDTGTSGARCSSY